MTPAETVVLSYVAAFAIALIALIWWSWLPHKPKKSPIDVDVIVSDLHDKTMKRLDQLLHPVEFEFLSIVEFTPEFTPESQRKNCPLHEGRSYVFMGEMPSMPHHCVVFDYKSGQMYAGYHINLFKAPNE